MLQTVSSPPSEARSPPPARRSDTVSSYNLCLTVDITVLQLHLGHRSTLFLNGEAGGVFQRSGDGCAGFRWRVRGVR
jgi:hypothetical protein